MIEFSPEIKDVGIPALAGGVAAAARWWDKKVTILNPLHAVFTCLFSMAAEKVDQLFFGNAYKSSCNNVMRQIFKTTITVLPAHFILGMSAQSILAAFGAKFLAIQLFALLACLWERLANAKASIAVKI